MRGTQVSISGLLSSEVYSARWVAMDTLHFYLIQNRFIFGDNVLLAFSGPTEQFPIHVNNCPWVQGKSNKPAPPYRGECVCVCVGGGEENS